ncbi:unnamed protein product, partial [Chrysoparadoxa australica]
MATADTLRLIDDVKVQFPFTPYECQKVYMEKVLEALCAGQNALLESPTGTGKTLCLLCSSLAWQQAQKAEEPGQVSINKPHTIIYTSRTHSQLSQVVRELKRTNYRPRISLLGSRDQMCVHPQVKQLRGAALNRACGTLVTAHKCPFQLSLGKGGGPSGGSQSVMDIEELAAAGKKEAFCPYYYGRQSLADADLVLMPYNYLVDRNSRKTVKVNWKGAVVIFDEAHNLEQVASEAASIELTSAHLGGAIGELTRASSAALASGVTEEADGAELRGKYLALKNLILALEGQIDSLKLPGNKGLTRPGHFIIDLLKSVDITFESHVEIVQIMEEAAKNLRESMPYGSPG